MAEEDSSNMPASMKPDTEWSTREKLAIGSYVLRTGEQHWSGVGRLLRPLGEPGRPPEWFSPKFCAQQYTALLEQMDAPKRKRGSERCDSSENIQPGSSPEEVIVARLTKERIEELKKQLRYERTEYRKLKREIELIESGTADDNLDNLINEIEGKEREDGSGDSDDVLVKEETEPVDSLAEEVRNEIEKLQREALLEQDEAKVEILDMKTNENDIQMSVPEEKNKEMESNRKNSDTTVRNADSNIFETLDIVSRENDDMEITERSNEVYISGSKDFTTKNTEQSDKTHKVEDDLKDTEPIVTKAASGLPENDILDETDDKEGGIEVEVDNKLNKMSDDKTEIEQPRKLSTASHDDTTSSEVEPENNTFNFSIDDNLQNSMSLPGTPAPPGSFVSDSFPSSPALSHSSDMDPDGAASWKAWRKSIMILWKQVASHRYASLFLQPVTDDIAPNYSTTVYRSMDLSTLKKNIENGVIRTTTEFHRDLMLMFQNAIMYNSREHDVYVMTTEMQKDVMDQVAQFMSTQMMAETAQPAANKSLRRSTMRRSAMSEKTGEVRSRRSGAVDNDARPSRS